VIERWLTVAAGLVTTLVAHAEPTTKLPPTAPPPATAAAATPAPSTSTTSTAAAVPATMRHGLAVGAELGEPTSATVGWFNDQLSFTGALGTGTRAGAGVSVHADAQYLVTRLRPDIPLRIGLGARYYHHGYQPMSADEVPDSHYGIRASAAVALERTSLQLYAELAPGVDVKRTASCTLADGPASICPHAQERPVFVQLVVGARWFLSH
jgi:hypothetical protein